MVRNVQPARPEDFTYYTHHPPLVPFTVSLSFALFGEHPWAARLVSVGFSLGSLLLVFLLGVEIGGRRLGLLAAFFFALLPMNAFYGRMANYEAATNFFALASAFFYLRWHRKRRGGLLALSLGALALGAAMDWPAYYLAGILPVHHLFASKGKPWDRKVILFPVLAVILFGLFLVHIRLLSGKRGLSDLASAFLFRARSEGTSRPPRELARAGHLFVASVPQDLAVPRTDAIYGASPAPCRLRALGQ